MIFPNAGAAQIISSYCHQTHYWEAIEGIMFKYLGCEIQDIEYNDQLQALLKLTDENIAVFIQYFKDAPKEYHPWMISVEIKTPNGVSILKVNIPEWNINNNMSWSHWHGAPSTKESDYEKVVEEIISLLKPICIGSN